MKGDTVADIIWDYLNKNGYDGLYQDGRCACKSDNLFPFCSEIGECKPGYLSSGDCGDDCGCECEDKETCDHEFHIGPYKNE